jgi:hypothetical protein
MSDCVVYPMLLNFLYIFLDRTMNLFMVMAYILIIMGALVGGAVGVLLPKQSGIVSFALCLALFTTMVSYLIVH